MVKIPRFHLRSAGEGLIKRINARRRRESNPLKPLLQRGTLPFSHSVRRGSLDPLKSVSLSRSLTWLKERASCLISGAGFLLFLVPHSGLLLTRWRPTHRVHPSPWWPYSGDRRIVYGVGEIGLETTLALVRLFGMLSVITKGKSFN